LRGEPPDQNRFLSIFCASPPQTPPPQGEKKKGKKTVLSDGFATVIPKWLVKTSFVAYATPLAIFPFLCELWRYVCGDLKVHSAQNTSHWPLAKLAMPAQYFVPRLVASVGV
jgi:hypothetical protein